MMKLFICLIATLMFQSTFAQEDLETTRKALSKTTSKSDVAFSFLNFQENLKDNQDADLNELAQLYGFSVSLNKRIFRGRFAYSLGAGYAQGYAVGGTKGSTIYYEKRVQWQAFLAQVGAYRRLSAYFEMGPVVMLQYKTIAWPKSGTTEAKSPPNPIGGVFMEFRQRLGTRYDLFENVGVLGEAKNTAWNIGLSFNL